MTAVTDAHPAGRDAAHEGEACDLVGGGADDGGGADAHKHRMRDQREESGVVDLPRDATWHEQVGQGVSVARGGEVESRAQQDHRVDNLEG